MAADSPIHHVILIIKENHTFDNYFGTFPGADGDATLDAAPNPPAFDPHHDHDPWLNRGRNPVRLQYAEADIPAYFAYGRQYTLCDRYFSEVAGPSTPNHLMLIAADSPILVNPPTYRHHVHGPTYALPSLPASLDQAGLAWHHYGGYAFDYIQGLKRHHGGRASGRFVVDARAGKLGAVSWVYAPEGLSEHPRQNVTAGMQWTVEQVQAVVDGGLWPSSLIFITWDDWGGWYDHVAPPNVEQWTDDGSHPTWDGTQFRYGSRVGCLALGPYVKQGYLSHALHSHVCLVKCCETLFGLAPLNARDAAADDMADCLDVTQAPAPPPALDQ